MNMEKTIEERIVEIGEEMARVDESKKLNPDSFVDLLIVNDDHFIVNRLRSELFKWHADFALQRKEQVVDELDRLIHKIQEIKEDFIAQ